MVTEQRKVLGVIPARYKSTRFEGKPLVKINGVPMIKRTYLQASKSPLLDDILVATEDKRIFDYCLSESIPVIMTSDQCLTGTDRLAEVAKTKAYDFYINIQGDEPIVDPLAITQLLEEYHKYNEKYSVYNLYKVIVDPKEIESDTIIKVIVNELDEMLYMSRLPVPFSNSSMEAVHKQQVPVYGFIRDALFEFSRHSKTLNEQFEDIELLRFVDLGYKVKMRETTVDSIAVDVPGDVLKVESFLSKKECKKSLF